MSWPNRGCRGNRTETIESKVIAIISGPCPYGFLSLTIHGPVPYGPSVGSCLTSFTIYPPEAPTEEGRKERVRDE